jgi:uncharacterized protein YggE
MNRSRVAVPVLVALATLGVASPALLAGPAFAAPGAVTAAPATDPAWESVQVTGTGKVYGQPDTFVANFAVETVGSTVSDALDRATAAANRMRDALVRAGIAKIDLRTSEVSITSRQNDKQVITGYTVNQGLTATIRDLPRAGTFIAAATTAGGDAARLNGVSFTIENDAALLAEARKKAFADARAKAALYAGEAGRPLGRVLTVSEETPGFGEGGGHKYSMSADAAMPIEPGRQQVTVTVTARWALDPLPARPGQRH